MTTTLAPTPAQAAWIADCTARARIERVLDAARRDCTWPLSTASVVYRPDAAYITVLDLDDLGDWLAALGGEITASPTHHGFETWTLLATVADWRGGDPVQVRVSAVVIGGEWDLTNWVAVVTS